MDTILIVDDETDLLSGLKRSIIPELNCRILTAKSGGEAINKLYAEPVNLVLTDINMPGIDGLELLQSVLQYDAYITVIMMTAFGTIEIAVKALKEGAYDFIQKPFDFEQLIRLLKKGVERNKLLRENNRLQQKVCEKAPLENLIGKSVPMQMVHKQIMTLGKTDVPVLIMGETGTGKDLAAQAIHAVSNRSHKPLITVNCPALPEGLLESEMFGHQKGAFTGADTEKKGLFDQAQSSTIFLDEIGDLPLSLQIKLLRVLQNREVKPVGSNQSHQVDARVIAATNQDLEAKIQNGEFRADLYYRLRVAPLIMPPLEEIKDDIPLLTNHFLNKAACELNIPPKTVSQDVIDYLTECHWNGNIRELENSIRGWMATISEEEIQLRHIIRGDRVNGGPSDTFQLENPYKELKEKVIENFTRDYITQLLTSTKGNITQSANISGIKRQSLQKIINRYNVDVARFRNDRS